MWDFDDRKEFALILHFSIPAIYTWGEREKEKREIIRRIAIKNLPKGHIFNYKWYGFRIKVRRRRKLKGRRFDIENVPKLIIDAFSKKLIENDNSKYPKCAIYKDDILDYVKAIQIEGDFNKQNSTEVWIFGKK
jgi:hypothetical protein